jgi:hypothetical protein
MFGAGWLNLGSLVFGLIAWVLPVVNLVQYSKAGRRNWGVFVLASVGACAISLCMQIFYTSHLVKIADWSALMDTSGAVALVAAVLLAGTIILNTITLIVYNKKADDANLCYAAEQGKSEHLSHTISQRDKEPIKYRFVQKG